MSLALQTGLKLSTTKKQIWTKLSKHSICSRASSQKVGLYLSKHSLPYPYISFETEMAANFVILINFINFNKSNEVRGRPFPEICSALTITLYLKRGMKQVLSLFEVIYQTRAIVLHQDIQTPIRELKIRRTAEYFFFDEIRVYLFG